MANGPPVTWNFADSSWDWTEMMAGARYFCYMLHQKNNSSLVIKTTLHRWCKWCSFWQGNEKWHLGVWTDETKINSGLTKAVMKGAECDVQRSTAPPPCLVSSVLQAAFATLRVLWSHPPLKNVIWRRNPWKYSYLRCLNPRGCLTHKTEW